MPHPPLSGERSSPLGGHHRCLPRQFGMPNSSAM